jgi:hypothetical protein
MLVEFNRYVARNRDPFREGEDDGIGQEPQAQPNHPIAINPALVSAVFESIEGGGNVTVIKLADGRGHVVNHTYAQVMETLRANGGVTPAN